MIVRATYLVFTCLWFAGAQAQTFDIMIKGGLVYDGYGQPPISADVAIRGDTIAAIGNLEGATARVELDAKGLALAPGFINMLSWADAALIKDGRSMSDIKQGVTLEVFGEGLSAAPRWRAPNDKRYRTLGEYFDFLENKGVSTNFCSFVGATTVRDYVLGKQNKKPNAQELEKMRKLVRAAMLDGAMGVGSSLIYAPADYADTNELVELSKAAGEFGGMYISHIRSESDYIFPALNEAFTIAREAKVAVEIHHIKINHQRNWSKVDSVVRKIDSARSAGLRITANMYPYSASGTGLSARLPTWVQEGGMTATCKRLKDPLVRARVLNDLRLGIPAKNSDPADVQVLGFRRDSLNKLYKGKRLDAIAKQHGKSADETMIDLIVADRSSVPSLFFLMSEDNVRTFMRLPYVSFCSDAYSIAAEVPFTDTSTHPRAYGSFARVLGYYVRDEKLLPLEEAVRRMTSLPAENLKLNKRGAIRRGYFADVVVFDPSKIADHATYEQPHQYAEGVVHVIVNGKQVLRFGEHTGARPGRAIRGPGYQLK